MAEVKWIKMSTGLPDNRKLKQIRRLPEGDTIALMWVFLMCLAGEVNEHGLIYFTPEIPYTDEMLADEFNMEINTIRLGLQTFQKFGMIEVVNDIICLSSWEKWQSTDRLSEIREYNRLAKQKSRAKQKLLQSQTVNEKSMTSQRCHDTDIDIEEDKDIDIDIEKDIKNKRVVRHKYGEYQNVLLSDEDYSKLINEFPNDYTERIERLSAYVASTGKSYKNHLATIRNWAKKDKPATKPVETEYNRFMSELKDIYMDGEV